MHTDIHHFVCDCLSAMRSSDCAKGNLNLTPLATLARGRVLLWVLGCWILSDLLASKKLFLGVAESSERKRDDVVWFDDVWLCILHWRATETDGKKIKKIAFL